VREKRSAASPLGSGKNSLAKKEKGRGGKFRGGGKDRTIVTCVDRIREKNLPRSVPENFEGGRGRRKKWGLGKGGRKGGVTSHALLQFVGWNLLLCRGREREKDQRELRDCFRAAGKGTFTL